MKGNLASRPLDFYFLLNVGPWLVWETEEGRAAGIRHGGSPGTGEKWGKNFTASRGTQGWARLGLGMAGAAAPRRTAAGGGGGGPVVGGDGERVGEYQWRARKLAAGVVGHEEQWRRELRGGLRGDGRHGGGCGHFRRKGARRAGSRAQGGRREG